MEEVPGRQSLERAVDHELAELLQSAEIAGSGMSGTVFRLQGEQVPVALVEKLKSLGEATEVPDTVAAKMLKVYEPGAAQREMRMQQKARKLVEGVANPSARADVPHVYFIHTVTFSSEEHERLTASGIRVGERADIILMDYVPGRDVKRILATEVMKHSEGATSDQIARTNVLRSDYIYAFLGKRGFTLHPTIADQVERTIRLLHRGSVFHHDLHEANIMVDGDPTMPDCQATIIDFGRASQTQRHAYEEEERPIDDLAVVRRIREQQLQQEGSDPDQLAYREDLDRLSELVEQGDPRWKDMRMHIATDPKHYLSSLHITSERDLSRAALGLVGAVRRQLISVSDASGVVLRIANRTTYAPLARKLRWLDEYLQGINGR